MQLKITRTFLEKSGLLPLSAVDDDEDDKVVGMDLELLRACVSNHNKCIMFFLVGRVQMIATISSSRRANGITKWVRKM